MRLVVGGPVAHAPCCVKLQWSSRKAWIRLGVLAGVAAVVLTSFYCVSVRMPGESFHGPLAPLTEHEKQVRVQLENDVVELAGAIGERNFLRRKPLDESAVYVEQQLSAAGYHVERQSFEVDEDRFENLVAELGGTKTSSQIVVVGAHYDSALGAPGANDNGSAVAAMLALARTLSKRPQPKSIRFVAFANEEPPYYHTDGMGSLQYARACRARNDDITAMISLETMGYFSSAQDSQNYPAPGLNLAYPTTGDFIAIVGDLSSRTLVRETIGSFRAHAEFPSEGAALPGFIPGVGWSDHWSFSQVGYRGVMVTDTAPFRYPHYHTAQDTPDKLDYDSLARVVVGVEGVIVDLASNP